MIRRSLAVTLTALLLAAVPVRAAELLQAKSLDASLGGISSLAFTPFDPALGTLTSARVAMNGVMSVQALASPFPGTAPGAFVPYSFSILSSRRPERSFRTRSRFSRRSTRSAPAGSGSSSRP